MQDWTSYICSVIYAGSYTDSAVSLSGFQPDSGFPQVLHSWGSNTVLATLAGIMSTQKYQQWGDSNHNFTHFFVIIWERVSHESKETSHRKELLFNPLSWKVGLSLSFVGFLGASMTRKFGQIIAILSVVTPVG